MKKTVTYLFKTIVALLLLGWSSGVSAQYAGGDGSENDPFQIATLDQLRYLSQNNNNDWATYYYYVQIADIDALATSSWDADKGFTPIGNASAPFNGSYNGQYLGINHTISRLHINRLPAEDPYVGLFGVIDPSSSSVIKNLGLLDVDVTCIGAEAVGAFGGLLISVENCYSTGTVEGTNNVGGLAGYLQHSKNCYSTCDVTGELYVGGFCGQHDFFSPFADNSLSNCYSSGTVTGVSNVGGFVGVNAYDVQSCYSTGIITAGTEYLGGFAGTNNGNITNCYSTGSVPVTATSGGLIGFISDGGGADNCFWNTQTSGQATSAGGTGKTTAEMKQVGLYLNATWDFSKDGVTDIWAYNGDYPFLRYEGKTPAHVWLGDNSSAWDLSSNWSEGTVPLGGNIVFITNYGTYPSVSAENLTIGSGGKLTLEVDGQLTVAGTFTNSTGSSGLVIKTGASLIENTAGVAATVESTMIGGNWHLISSPVSNATSMMFTGKYLQELNESTNSYTDITNDATPLTPMKGFAIFDAAGFTAQYAGSLNTSDQSFNYTKSGSPGEGYNLVGNPYPSSINWDLVVKPASLNNATYRHVDNNTWAAYVDNVSVPLIAGTDQFIAPGQGFLVQATDNGTLTFTNAAKAHHATEFYKNSKEEIKDLVRLQVTGNGYSDEAVVRFLSDATSEFDGKYDAHKLYGDVNEAPQIYSVGSTPLAINALPETGSVPVGVHVGVTGSFTIAATEMKDLKYVTLEDTKTGVFTDLSVKSYTFNFTAGENEQRFVLHFSALAVNETESVSANVYSNNQTVYVNMKDQVKGDISIYDISGKLVTTKLGVQGMNEISIATTGNYIVKVITRDNTLVKKVFIK